MFHKTFVPHLEALTQDQPKASTLWGFRRRATAVAEAPAPAEDASFAVDSLSTAFESFGRSGLQLGGLHRDQQWVGAWGGRW
jgi:hypothetical protein